MSVHDRKNLKSALESAILYLQKQGVEEARQDAWLLLEHVCGISHSTYFVHSEDEMPKEQQEQYEALKRALSWNDGQGYDGDGPDDDFEPVEVDY